LSEKTTPTSSELSWKNAPTWMRHAAWAVFMAGIAGFLVWYFTDFENSKESSRSMNWIFATLYNVGGKYLPVGVSLVGAVGYAVWAVAEFRKKDDAPDAGNAPRRRRGPSH
jgi:hypothetical protein